MSYELQIFIQDSSKAPPSPLQTASFNSHRKCPFEATKNRPRRAAAAANFERPPRAAAASQRPTGDQQPQSSCPRTPSTSSTPSQLVRRSQSQAIVNSIRICSPEDSLPPDSSELFQNDSKCSSSLPESTSTSPEPSTAHAAAPDVREVDEPLQHSTAHN